MSLSNIYKSLSPEQVEILQTKKLQGSFKPNKLAKLLRDLAAYDRLNDEKRAGLSTLKGWLMTLAGTVLIGVFISVVTEAFTITLYLGVALMVSVFIIVFLGLRVKKLAKTDLIDEMRRVLLPFALVMQEEARPGSKMTISLDANQPKTEPYLVDTQERTQRYGRSISTYQQDWLSANVTLIDGSAIGLMCSKTVFDVNIVKRSASGKTKYKNKLKSRDDVIVKMIAPKALYNLASPLPSIPTIRVVEASDSFVIRGKYKFKTTDIKTLQVQVILKLISDMYRTLRPIAQTSNGEIA